MRLITTPQLEAAAQTWHDGLLTDYLNAGDRAAEVDDVLPFLVTQALDMRGPRPLRDLLESVIAAVHCGDVDMAAVAWGDLRKATLAHLRNREDR